MPSRLNPNAVIECVPNFSEGTDEAKVASIVAAMQVEGVRLLDWSLDVAHNRSVVTIAGPPAGVFESAVRGVGRAAQLIDLNQQKGVHPRIGAADVVPFVPVSGVSLAECAMLARLTAGAEWTWVEGNHDPKPPDWLGGRVAAEIALGGLVFRHVPSDAQAGEVAGHLHPATRVKRNGMSVRRRCFVSDGARLLLPAFGAYAGGLDVRDDAIASLFADGFAVYALGRERVYMVHMPRRKKSDEIQPSSAAIRTVKRP